jgi:hypothetical protein
MKRVCTDSRRGVSTGRAASEMEVVVCVSVGVGVTACVLFGKPRDLRAPQFLAGAGEWITRRTIDCGG